MATFKKRLEYIASTEESPARFTISDFSWVPALGDVIEVEALNQYETTTSTTYEYRANYGGLFYAIYPAANNFFFMGSGSQYVQTVNIDPNNYQKVTVQYTVGTEGKLFIDDVLSVTRATSLSIGSVPSFPFMWGRGDNVFNIYHKKKYIKIIINGTLLYDFIPVLDDNDVPCWFNRVDSSLLYADEGYTPTVYGEEVPMYANEVEYIGSNNNARFTISNLGITTSKNLLIESDIKWLNYPNSINGEYRLDLVGGWQGANSSGKWILATGIAGGNVSTTEFQNVKFYLDNTHSRTSILIDNEETIYRVTNPLTIDYVNVFYGTYGATTYYANNLKKYIKVFVDDELVRDYVPVIDIDGVPAFYDKVTNTMLYADAGYVPTIVGGVVEYECGDGLRERQLLIANKTILPYYCELEYIQMADNTPRFMVKDLGVTSSDVLEYETSVQWTAYPSASMSIEGDSGVGGRWYGISTSGYYLLHSANPSTTLASTTSWDKVTLKIDNANTTTTLYVNDTYIINRPSVGGSAFSTYPICWSNAPTSYQIYQKKRWSKFYLNGQLIRDYIPVLDYDRVPCWYDRVNGNFLYAETGYTPTVWGREIHPIPRIHKERLLNYDLGASPLDVTDSIEMKFLRDDPSVTNILFRQAETVSDVITKLTTTSVSNKYFASSWFYDGSSGSGNTFSAMDYNIPTELIIKSGTIIVDGVSDVLSNTGTSLPNGNFYLFGLPSNSSKFYGYFYYFRIRSAGGTLKMNIIPIVDETGTPYLWDSVGRTILTSSGSGALTYDPIKLDYVANTLYTGSNIGGAFTTIPYKANQNTCIKATIKIDDMQISRYIMGANGYFISHGVAGSSDRIRFNYNYNSVDLFNLPSYTNVININKIKEKNIVNGIEIDNSEGEFTVADNFNIFTSSSLNNSLVGRVYAVEVSEQSSIFFNLIPAIKDGQIGLLDTLTNTLYPSQRTGVNFFPNFLPQFNKFNALDGLNYWEWEIDTTLLDANNKTFGFYQNVTNFDIDWGDNNYEVGQTSHTYATAGKYTIRIYKKGNLGRFYWYDSSTPNQYSVCLTAVNTPMPMINQSDLSNCFRGCTNLSKVCDNFFVNNRHATYLNYFFYECPINYIPKNILKGMYLLGSVTGLFGKTNISEVPVDLFADVKTNCTLAACFTSTKIKTLPAHLLDRLVDCTNASQFVNQCTELEYLPDLFFQYQTKITSWRYLAYGSTKLKLNANLFCDEATEMATHFAGITPDFTGAFSRTSYTGTTPGTAPQLWNYTYGGTPTTQGCFSGAGNQTLTNYSSIPQAWGGAA